MTRTVYVLAAIGGARALAFWLVVRAGLDPDTGLYAQGGFGLFPSPLGRLLGNGGVWALALANVAANVLLVLGAAQLARVLGGRPVAAALVALLAPLALWTMFAGVDTIAAAAVVWMLYALAVDRRRLALALGVAAAGFHLAALLVLGAIGSARGGVRLGLLVAALAVVLALATPYRSLLSTGALVVASSTAITFAVFLLTFMPALLRLRPVVPVLAGGALAAGLVAGSTWETNMRYTLPAVPVAAAYSTVRRVPL